MGRVVMYPKGIAELTGKVIDHTRDMAERGEGRVERGTVRAGRIETGQMLNSVTSFPDPTNPRRFFVGFRDGEKPISDWNERGTRERREDDGYPAAAPAIEQITPGNRGVPAAHIVRDAAYTPEL